MVVVDGFIGNDPEYRSRARLYIETANANIAGMQQQLYFPPDRLAAEWDPRAGHDLYPNLAIPGYPDDRLIAVDIESGVTRVMNSDYFGESKKGGLRMWNAKVFHAGGLAMHAGCKVVPTDAGERTLLIIGLSGTGKTTTTFTRQNGSQPVQDDFIGLFPGGKVVGPRTVLRQDLRPRSAARAGHPWRGNQARRLSRERLAAGSRWAGRLLRPGLHLERAATFLMASLGIWRDPRHSARSTRC